MESPTKITSKKPERHTTKSKNRHAKRDAEIKHIIHNLIHPDYVLFDWEFFSNQLEFE
jgi:hypothetical protein